jgi:hypothetical protein
MKIAFIDYVLDPAQSGASGLSDVVWNMARELAKLGDDVHVFGRCILDVEWSSINRKLSDRSRVASPAERLDSPLVADTRE